MKEFILACFLLCLSLVWSEEKKQTSSSEEECRIPNGLLGICVPLIDCPSLYKINDEFLLQNFYCGANKNSPKVCCFRSDVKSSRITDTNQSSPFDGNIPSKYSIINSQIDCGHSLHTGKGTKKPKKSEFGAWPWLAAIYFWRNSRIRETICGGALITDKHVITAAHCTVDINGNTLNASSLTVRLGEYKLNTDKDGACPLDFFVEEIRSHPNFTVRTYENDIAILVLREIVSFTDYIQPICLPYGELANANSIRNAFVAGWGDTTFDGNFRSHLMEMELVVWSHKNCLTFPQRGIFISENHVCAGISDIDINSCQGDSGGPLMFPIKFLRDFTKFYLLGVLSYGKQCALMGYPNRYTGVFYYMDWISTNLL